MLFVIDGSGSVRCPSGSSTEWLIELSLSVSNRVQCGWISTELMISMKFIE